jgi:hypothetical protein
MGGTAIGVISAMITPALLILRSGSLVASALLRLGRSVDPARVLIAQDARTARTNVGSGGSR